MKQNTPSHSNSFSHSQPQKGDRISEYVLVQKIGEGGFGQVWKAHHHVFRDQLVAIKILKPLKSRDHLKREGLIQNKLYQLLEEKNLQGGMVELKGFDPYADRPYMVMEYVEGISLRDHLNKKKKMPLSSVEMVFEKILDVLSVAHKAGLVHGDLKPENILIGPLDEIKLVDFGVSRFVEGTQGLAPSMKLSSSEKMEGTLAYMAPEQRKGQPLDPRADVYALGILLCEMLVGDRPQGGECPSDLLDSLPGFVDKIYQKCYTHQKLRYLNAQVLRREWRKAKKLEETQVRNPHTMETSFESSSGIHLGTPSVVDQMCKVEKIAGPQSPWMALLQDGQNPQKPNSLAQGALQCPKCHRAITSDKTFCFRPSPHQLTCTRCGYRNQIRAFYPLKGAALELANHPLNPGLKAGLKAYRGTPAGSSLSPSAVSTPRPAGLGIRLLAFGLDMVVLVMIFPLFIAGAISQEIHSFPLVLFTYLNFIALYFIFTTSLLGATPGKAVLGLRVVDCYGNRIHLGESMSRFIGYFFSLFLFGFGFYIILFHPKKRGLHDFFGSSWVIRKG